MRILLAMIGFMLIAGAAHAWSGKQRMWLEEFTTVEQGAKSTMMLVQDRDEGNSRRNCGRRDTPPLSS